MAHAKTKPVNLALQGGGAHGAFTWGVLDALLEDGRIHIAAMSGTSAGAMNATVLTSGFASSGADGARQALFDFWQKIGGEGVFTGAQLGVWQKFFGGVQNMSGDPFGFFSAMSNMFSPYDTNPLNLNPVRNLLNAEVDFEKVRASAIQLFIAATNVHTGKLRVFKNSELSADAVMASACLPYVFHAVEIDGVPYWDGGYLGNPPLYPFFSRTDVEDILLIQVNPIERNSTPHSAQEIADRLNEITFNASLLAEYRAIDFVRRLIEAGKLEHGEYKKVRMHRIDADKTLAGYSAASKMNVAWPFLLSLRDSGRDAAKDWLERNFDNLGVRQTLDIQKEIA